MDTKTRKTVFVHMLLIVSAITPNVHGQLIGTAYGNTHAYSPVSSNAFPFVKGFIPALSMGTYYSQPVNTMYWTGQPTQLVNYPQQYPYSSQYSYSQYPSPYYKPQYGYSQKQSGYDYYYGNYPSFDASYWTGAVYQPAVIAQQVPVYHVPVYRYPVNQMVYYQHPIQPLHPPVIYPAYPYYEKGFFGGTGGQLAKGLLGALMIGVIAGKVARG